MKNKITKEMLEDVFNEIIIPLEKKIKKYIKNREKINQILLQLKPLHLSLKPFLPNVDLEKIKSNLENLKESNKILEFQLLVELYGYFCDLLTNYMKKRDINCEYCKDLYSFLAEKEEEIDEFIDFDTEFDDENINNMHYEENQKISAKEFMSYNEIDNETLSEIDELLDEFSLIEENELDEHFINEFLKIINDFIHLFNLTIEFENISYSLTKLNILLQNLDLNSIDKNLLKQFLILIIDDLAKFKDEVFVNKSAIDIHYMDASLLANVAQLEIMLNQKEDNEIEFF